MRLIARILLLALASAALPVFAQSYPSRPVRVIIAFPPGSATDIIGRIILGRVSELWGQQAVTDNRGGAGGSLGTAIAARGAPDGHTLLINSGAFTVAPAMYKQLPYDTQKDFVDLAALVAMPNVLCVNPSSKLMSELVTAP